VTIRDGRARQFVDEHDGTWRINARMMRFREVRTGVPKRSRAGLFRRRARREFGGVIYRGWAVDIADMLFTQKFISAYPSNTIEGGQLFSATLSGARETRFNSGWTSVAVRKLARSSKPQRSASAESRLTGLRDFSSCRA